MDLDVTVQKRKGKKFWIKMIRAIHHRKIREKYVDDGTEEPEERTDITDIFREGKYCFTCGRPLKYPQVKYCLNCK